MFNFWKKEMRPEFYGEIIVKIPRDFMPDLEIVSKQRGFKNSRELIARFVKKQLALYYNIEPDNIKLSDIK